MAKTVARVLPRRPIGVTDDDLIHTCGLCHGLGGAIAHISFPKAWRAAASLVNEDQGGPGRDPISFGVALRHTLGIDANGIGALMARSWCLPAELAACMRYSSRVTKAPDPYQPIVAVVHIARELVRGCGFIVTGDPFVESISPDAIDILNLRPADLEIAIRGFGDEWEELELYEGVLSGS